MAGLVGTRNSPNSRISRNPVASVRVWFAAHQPWAGLRLINSCVCMSGKQFMGLLHSQLRFGGQVDCWDGFYDEEEEEVGSVIGCGSAVATHFDEIDLD
jgi:hypothetical protein